jgi:hypothetical protein
MISLGHGMLGRWNNHVIKSKNHALERKKKYTKIAGEPLSQP